MKKCKTCREVKQERFFYEHQTTADRLYPSCKACMSEKRRADNKKKESVSHRLWLLTLRVERLEAAMKLSGGV